MMNVSNSESKLSKICNKIVDIIKLIGKCIVNIFKPDNKKVLIQSECEDSCCCNNCKAVIAYDQKEDDDSQPDIIITNSETVIS